MVAPSEKTCPSPPAAITGVPAATSPPSAASTAAVVPPTIDPWCRQSTRNLSGVCTRRKLRPSGHRLQEIWQPQRLQPDCGQQRRRPGPLVHVDEAACAPSAEPPQARRARHRYVRYSCAGRTGVGAGEASGVSAGEGVGEGGAAVEKLQLLSIWRAGCLSALPRSRHTHSDGHGRRDPPLGWCPAPAPARAAGASAGARAPRSHQEACRWSGGSLAPRPPGAPRVGRARRPRGRPARGWPAGRARLGFRRIVISEKEAPNKC